MKIAVPSKDERVDEHFGHCQYFTVFTVGEDKKIVSEERFTPDPACGCKSNLAGRLAEMGVGVLIAGNMGEGAVARLSQSGIKVVRGANGPVVGAVEAWLAGKLTDNLVLCHAHAHGHECAHGLKSL